jgi:hypothetical protein
MAGTGPAAPAFPTAGDTVDDATTTEETSVRADEDGVEVRNTETQR